MGQYGKNIVTGTCSGEVTNKSGQKKQSTLNTIHQRRFLVFNHGSGVFAFEFCQQGNMRNQDRGVLHPVVRRLQE